MRQGSLWDEIWLCQNYDRQPFFRNPNSGRKHYLEAIYFGEKQYSVIFWKPSRCVNEILEAAEDHATALIV